MSRTIFAALSAVQTDLARVGISKDQTNDFDKYKFRGIDDVLNALAPILSEHGVLIVPSVAESTHNVVQTSQGKPSHHWKVVVDYHLYDKDGDSIVHRAHGECMDRGDKGLNKAMTAAFKYFVFQAFCVPLQGQDADSDSPELGSGPVPMPEHQLDEIKGLLMTTNTEGPDFMAWITGGKESDINRLDAGLYERAKSALERKLSKMSREYAENESAASDGGASNGG